MDAVELVAYDHQWPAQFVAEAIRLRALVASDGVIAIEHIGSTAIPGLRAKPIIDILMIVPSLPQARLLLPDRLQALGYAFWADNPKTDRLFFVKGLPPAGPGRTHHVHVAEPGSEPLLSLRFRDHLRSHPEQAQRYVQLKDELALRHHSDREAYTAAKTTFVQEILSRDPA